MTYLRFAYNFQIFIVRCYKTVFVMYTVHSSRTSVWKRLLVTAFTIVFILYTFNISERKKTIRTLEAINSSNITPLWEQTLDFHTMNFSNETGYSTGCYIVPNYIHFIHFGGEPINFLQLICILAAFKNQKPEKIFVHYDNETTFTGKYWEVLVQTPGFNHTVIFNMVPIPNEIFGRPISKVWRKWHGSDIIRIRMMMKYGGIYLDNDSYLVKSVDNYRRFEISLNWNIGQYISNGVIIAHKNARFLKRWMNSYKVYRSKKWFYNGGERPTLKILHKKPELVHRVKVVFGMDNKFVYSLYGHLWLGWKDLYILHLFASARLTYTVKHSIKNVRSPLQFDENNIAYYPIAFREMAYDVYDIANIQWSKNRFEMR